MKKVLSIILSLTLALSMLSGFAFANTDDNTRVAYTVIDYSKLLEVNNSQYSYLYDDAPCVQLKYPVGSSSASWNGNCVGYTAYLRPDSEYTIYFEVVAEDEEAFLQPDVFVFHDQLTGSTATDYVLAENGNGNGNGKGTVTKTFTTPEDSVIRPFKILCMCRMQCERVSYKIKIEGADDEPTYAPGTMTTNMMDYPDLDYTREIKVDGPSYVDRIVSYGKAVNISGFLRGNSIDAYARLEEGKTYEATLIIKLPNTDTANFESRLAILTDDELTGHNYDGFGTDALAVSEMKDMEEANVASVSVKYTPEYTAFYRILGVCRMSNPTAQFTVYINEVDADTDTEVNTDIGDYTALVLPEVEYLGTTINNFNDNGDLAIGPNGEFAVADYYSEYDTDLDEYNYYLRVYDKYGNLTFKAPLPNRTDATPVFDDEGNVYIATYDSDLDSETIVSYVCAFSPEGEELWTVDYEGIKGKEDFDVWCPLYISDNVLIVCFDSEIMGFEKDTGSSIWSIPFIDCDRGNPNDGLTVADGIIYLALCGYNTVYYKGEQVELYNPILLIDADDGKILEYIDGLNGNGATGSVLVVEGDYLYFFVDGTEQYGDEEIDCPFCILDLTNGQIVKTDLGFDDEGNFVISLIAPNSLFVSDSAGNAALLYIEDGEVTFALPIDLEYMIFRDDEDHDALKLVDIIIPRENVKNMWIDDAVFDKNGNFYVLAEMKSTNDDWYCCIIGVVNEYDEEGKQTGESITTILPLYETYGHTIKVTDDYLYFSEGYGPIYAIRVPDYPSDDTDTESDTETDTEPDVFLKGDINNDGFVDIIDVAMARAHIVGNNTLDAEAIKRGDMNDDGIVDIVDVAMMRKYIVDKK